MPLPTNFGSVVVKGTYVGLDGQPIAGSVTFTPTVTSLVDASAVVTVVPKSLTVALDSGGSFITSLPATDDPDLTPSGWTYTVQENFAGGRKFSITVPVATPVGGLDISTLAPVPTSGGTLLVPDMVTHAELEADLAARDLAASATYLPAEPWAVAGPALTNPRPAHAIRMSTYDSGATDPADDIETALAAAAAVAVNAGKAELVMDSRQRYTFSRTPRAGAHGELAIVRLPYSAWTFASPTQQRWIEIVGMRGGDVDCVTVGGAGKVGTVFESTLASASSPTYASTTGIASVIGGPASYSSINAAAATSNSICPVFRDITIVQPANPPLGGIDLGWMFCAGLDNVNVTTAEFLAWAGSFAFTVPTKLHAVGIQFPFVNCNPPVRVGSACVSGYAVGFGLGECLEADVLIAEWCQGALSLDVGNHPNSIKTLYDVNCALGICAHNPQIGASFLNYPINGPGYASGQTTVFAASAVIDTWKIQWNNGQSAGFNRLAGGDIADANDVVPVHATYSVVKAGVGVVSDGLTVPAAWTGKLARLRKMYPSAPRISRTRRSAGNLTINGTNFVAADTATDIVLDAAPGQWVKVNPNGVWGNEAIAGVLEIVTVVGGTPVNSIGANAAYSATGYSIDNWQGQSGAFSFITGTLAYQLTAADISNGTVRLRLMARTTTAGNKTLYGSGTDTLDFTAEVVS